MKQRKQANKYQCTVHTLEIAPIMTTEWTGKEYDWWKSVYLQGFDFIDNKDTIKGYSIREPRLIINPHKLHKGESGKFVFEYRNMEVIQADMDKISELMDTDGYNLKRLDICFDCGLEYEANEKIIRLIQLMMACDWDNQNLYRSCNPLTLETKTTRCSNSKKYRETLVTEHYNRELLPQEDWENEPIRNRFELRMMRQQIPKGDVIRDVALKWLKSLNGLGKQQMDKVTGTLTKALYEQWDNYFHLSGHSSCKNISTMRNSFYSFQASNIFTRKQLKELYEIDGEEDAVDNVLKADRYGRLFDFYKFSDVQAEIEALKDALKSFMCISHI